MAIPLLEYTPATYSQLADAGSVALQEPGVAPKSGDPTRAHLPMSDIVTVLSPESCVDVQLSGELTVFMSETQPGEQTALTENPGGYGSPLLSRSSRTVYPIVAGPLAEVQMIGLQPAKLYGPDNVQLSTIGDP